MVELGILYYLSSFSYFFFLVTLVCLWFQINFDVILLIKKEKEKETKRIRCIIISFFQGLPWAPMFGSVTSLTTVNCNHVLCSPHYVLQARLVVFLFFCFLYLSDWPLDIECCVTYSPLLGTWIWARPYSYFYLLV